MARVAHIGGVIPDTTLRKARSFFATVTTPRFRLFGSVIFVVLAVAGCSTNNNYATRKAGPDFVRPDFAQRRSGSVRVAVMLPQVEIERLRFWREKKARPGETAAMALKVQKLIEAQLNRAGFAVQTASTNSTNTVEARQRLDEWMNSLSWTSSPESLGPTAKVLVDDAHADALVCVRFTRTKTTWQRRIREYHSTAASWVGAVAGAGGTLAGLYFSHANNIEPEWVALLTIGGGVGGFFLFRETSWLITGGGDQDDPLPNRAVLDVAFVDGATGEVLWSNSAVVETGDKSPEPMAENIFLNFPQ